MREIQKLLFICINVMKIKILNTKGDSAEEIDFNLIKKGSKVSHEILNQYVYMYHANQRQGTSKVKDRSEVKGSGKKPWRQKGTGRARAGSRRSPIWVGGGVAHGPVPKEWRLKMNKKMKAKAFEFSLALKLKDKKLVLVNFEGAFDKYSTKEASKFIKNASLNKRLLIIVKEGSDFIYRSFRNIPYVEVRSINNVNAYDVLIAENVLVDQAVSKSLSERLNYVEI